MSYLHVSLNSIKPPSVYYMDEIAILIIAISDDYGVVIIIASGQKVGLNCHTDLYNRTSKACQQGIIEICQWQWTEMAGSGLFSADQRCSTGHQLWPTSSRSEIAPDVSSTLKAAISQSDWLTSALGTQQVFGNGGLNLERYPCYAQLKGYSRRNGKGFLLKTGCFSFVWGCLKTNQGRYNRRKVLRSGAWERMPRKGA